MASKIKSRIRYLGVDNVAFEQITLEDGSIWTCTPNGDNLTQIAKSDTVLQAKVDTFLNAQ